MTQKARLLSGRVPVTGPTAVTSDRYQFLGLDQAEPNLGTATNGNVLTTNIYGVRTWSNAISLANLTVGNVAANTVTVSTGLFWSNGVPFTAYGNTDVTGFLSSYTGNIAAGNVNTTGNVTASYVLGNGSKLTGMNAYANIDVAGYLPTYTGNITANNVTVTSGFRGNIFADIITPYQTTITAFNSSTAIKLPVGDNSTRPTGVAGYIRYSTAGLAPEYYNGTTWISINNAVTSQTFSGDGTNVTYTLDQTTTQAGVLVSINGTLQQPGVAYTVSGTQITFAEIPLTTDVIDIRFLGSLVSALATYSNTNVAAYLTSAGDITSGNVIPSANITYNLGDPTHVWNRLYLATEANINGITVSRGGAGAVTSTAVGVSALLSETTGSQNTAVGALALKNVNGGIQNTATGYNSLLNTTTGNANSAFGAEALGVNTIGYQNAALGYYAGRLLASGGSNLRGNTSVYLGAYARSAANDQMNQIVIGALAYGHGSNSAVIGDDTLTKTVLKGNVVITSTTQANLYVSGDTTVTGNISANVITANTLIVGGVTSTRATNGYNNWRGNTYANVDNVSCSVFSNGAPAFSSVSGTMNYFWSSITTLTGGAFFGNTSTGGAVTTFRTTVGTSILLGSGGDTVRLTLQDQDLRRMYNVTYAQTVGSGNCAIVIERTL